MQTQAVADGESPLEDTRAFRRSLGQFGTGVTVVTSQVDGELVGVTANSFSSLSIDPPLILWSVARTSRSFHLFNQADVFVVNILAADQIEISQRFSSSAVDKFEGIGWRRGSLGAPILDNVAGYFECRTDIRHDGGDHVIMVGRVEKYRRYDGDVLLFAQGRYALAQDHPALTTVANPNAAPGGPANTRMAALILSAYRAISPEIDANYAKSDVSFGQGMILYSLLEGPAASVQALADEILLPTHTLRYECDDLLRRGLVQQAGDGAILLSDSGRKVRQTLNDRADRFERGILKGISPELTAAARQFLIEYARVAKAALASE